MGFVLLVYCFSLIAFELLLLTFNPSIPQRLPVLQHKLNSRERFIF